MFLSGFFVGVLFTLVTVFVAFLYFIGKVAADAVFGD